MRLDIYRHAGPKGPEEKGACEHEVATACRAAGACPAPYDKNARVTVVRGPVPRVLVSPRSFRTLISIEYAMCQGLKVRRTLMCQTGPVVFTLRSYRPSGCAKSVFYRHAGPKGPEERFSQGRAFQKLGKGQARAIGRSRGTGPRATVQVRFSWPRNGPPSP